MASVAATWPVPDTSAKSIVVHYEVHVLHQDRWVIDCTGRDEQAVREVVQDYVQRPEIAGVRLIKELYNPETNRAASRVLIERLRPKREPRRVFLAARPSAAGDNAPKPVMPSTSSPMAEKPVLTAAPAGGGMPVAAIASIAVGFLLVVTLVSLLAWR